MDRLRAGLFRDFQDRVAAQVAVLRPRAADRPSLVGQPHVLRVSVGLRVHRHRGDAEPARGADHPAGDFAAVGDEDLFKHACLCSEALPFKGRVGWGWVRSEEHTSELQSLMRISYAVFCLKKKKTRIPYRRHETTEKR